MSQRQAVTKAAKGVILDELCATTGWHRSHARKAFSAALGPRLVRSPPQPRTPKFGTTGHRRIGVVLGAPAGKRLAPMMADLVAPASAVQRAGDH